MIETNFTKATFKFRLIPIIIFFMFLMLTFRLKGLFVSFTEMENPLFTNTKAIASDPNAKSSPKETELIPFGAEYSPGYLLTESEQLEKEKKKLENFSQAELEVLQSLAKRREEIEAREKQLEQQVALLRAAEGQIEQKINALKNYEKNIKILLGEYDKKEQERLQGLVDLYTKMKPKDAAIIFDELEMNILITLFERMRTQNAAAILSAMTPEKARALTIELAERNHINKSSSDKESTILR